MDSQLQNLLDELYSVDPALRSKEKELKEIISVLLKSKPNIVLDEVFRERLRLELQKHSPKPSIFSNIMETGRMKKFNFAFGSGLFLLLIVAAVGLQINRKNQTSQVAESGKIIRVADNAFGGLQNAQSTTGLGGGGPSGAASLKAPSAPNDTNPSIPMPDMRIYNPVTFHYIYKGSDIAIPDKKLEVLKKSDTSFDSSGLASLLNKMNFGMLDFNGFSNLSLDSFTVSQKDGYAINVNPKQGNLNIYAVNQNYVCAKTEAPCTIPPTKITEVPADQELIDAANQFIKDHKINIDNYGKPEVVNDWKIQYEQAADKASVYVPDSGIIVYPLEINGIGVYDQMGNKTGLTVGVNFKSKKVMRLGELDFSNYQSSLYNTETDISKIMTVVENGGVNEYPSYDASAKVEDVELGSPKLQLMMYWNYQNNESTQLYVPALVFPVTKAPASPYFYKKNVIVPIIKDILNAPQPPIRIMNSAPGSAPMK